VTIRRQQHQLRADDDPVGQRQAAGPLHKLATDLVVVELDRCGRQSHAITFVNLAATPFSTTELAAGSTKKARSP